jgi:hypothetical protein
MRINLHKQGFAFNFFKTLANLVKLTLGKKKSQKKFIKKQLYMSIMLYLWQSTGT